jgi:hypothetical protein
MRTEQKPTLLYREKRLRLWDACEDIPFDLKHRFHVEYEGSIKKLKQELTKWVRWAVENPKGAYLPPDSTLECFVNGAPRLLPARSSSLHGKYFRR